MLRYRVIKKGFLGGQYYDPQTRHRVVEVDKPLKPVPSWLELMTQETAAARDKRLKKEGKETKKTAEKTKQDDDEIAALETI